MPKGISKPGRKRNKMKGDMHDSKSGVGKPSGPGGSKRGMRKRY